MMNNIKNPFPKEEEAPFSSPSRGRDEICMLKIG
jgi:hypothetical protein